MPKKKTPEVVEAAVALLAAIVLAVICDRRAKEEQEKNS